jgi:hypothetical protein
MEQNVGLSDHGRPWVLPPLEQALEYRFDDVVYKFTDYYSVPFDVASEFFCETRKWLWLCARSEHERRRDASVPELAITAPLFWLDEMWHIFLQFTRQYQEFCMDCCGAFVHHVPTSHAEKVSRREIREQAPQALLEERKNKLRAQCLYIQEHLGEETLRRWYCDFAKEYSPEKLQERGVRRRPIS